MVNTYGDGAYGDGPLGGSLPTGAGYGQGAYGDGAYGGSEGAPVTPAIFVGATSMMDRFGHGKFAGTIGAFVIIPPTLIPDPFGIGRFGARALAPTAIEPGTAYGATVYATVGRIGASGGVSYLYEAAPALADATILPKLRAPVIMVLSADRLPVAVIAGYESFTWTDRWREPDEWELVVNANVPGALALGTGTFVAAVMPSGETVVGMIEDRSLSVSGHENTEMIVATGRDLGALLEARIAIMNVREDLTEVGPSGVPGGDGCDNWRSTSTFNNCRPGSAAGAMAYFIWHNLVGNTDNLTTPWRQIPHFAIGPIPDTRQTVAYNARYQPLTEILMEISLATGIGWRIRYDADDDTFYFEPRLGRDMTATVAFSPAFGTVEAIGFSHSTMRSRNVAYVAGEGIGADRDLYLFYDSERYAAAPTGLALREAFVDAGDLGGESGDTAQDRAKARFGELADERTVELALIRGSTAYPADFDVGDIVHAEYPGWGVAETRVVAATRRWDASGHATTLALGAEPVDVKRMLTTMNRRQVLKRK